MAGQGQVVNVGFGLRVTLYVIGRLTPHQEGGLHGGHAMLVIRKKPLARRG